jgi:ABC-type sulfate/molybdate transport systems ATPase subunit
VLEVDVTVDRRDFTVHAAFRAGPGERVALFGPSGAGKTTILEAIAGLDPAWRGTVVANGHPLPPQIPPHERRIGLLRQDPALFSHLTVRENLLYARNARSTELDTVALDLDIADLLDDRPARLSGGQAHRVALGRLLLAHVDALLFDEPYTGLDAALRAQLTGMLREISRARSVPSILVAHELAEAQAFADRMLILDAGRVLADGAPDEVVARPVSRRVASLVGYRAFLPFNGGVAGVHPDRVAAGSGEGLLFDGTVVATHPAGPNWEAVIDVSGVPVTGRFSGRPPAVGERMEFTVTSPPVFGADGTLL